ncbi:MAG: hypothetical protein Kow006_24570 [Gammaproteobacteria bacterium]
MAKRQQIRFSLSISADRFLAYYRGDARQVVVKAEDGRTLRFPANVLQPFLTHEGITGDFVLEYDQHNRFTGIRKLANRQPIKRR